MTNTPEARSETGELKDQGFNTVASEASVSEATPLGGQTPASGAPDTYSDFTIPEGIELDKSIIETATPIFKELNLTQDQAQKLVDFYNQTVGGVKDNLLKAVEEMRADWRNQVMADKEIGGKLDSIKVEIGRAKSKLQPALREAFDEAMNITGAGDHPAFIKAFYELSKLVNEGTYVPPGSPSPLGQVKDGQIQRPSLASSMYPYLPQ